MKRYFASLLILLLSSASVPASLTTDPSKEFKLFTVSDMVGEHQIYAIDFLFFDKLAAGELILRATDQPDVFEAELVGRTLGIAAWLTGDRTQRYVSRMQLMPDGRLRSLVHESNIHKRKRGKWRDTGKHYFFDYAAGKVTRERVQDGESSSTEVYDLPIEDEPVDILTAFYNMRAGVYGEIVPGRNLHIPTFSEDGINVIVVDVLTPSERLQYSYFSSEGQLLRIHIDPEIFQTDSGNLYVWFNDDGVPARGIIEDVIGMGDVRGYQEAAP